MPRQVGLVGLVASVTKRSYDMAGNKGWLQGRLIVRFVLCAAVVVAVILYNQEQRVRHAAENLHQALGELIVAGKPVTDLQVHEHLGREPDESRRLKEHRWVERYDFPGNFSTYTVYAYYTTAATKLLTATSINQEHPDWKQTE